MTAAHLDSKGSGIYRRRIWLCATITEVHAALEDDFHHFSLVLRHDGDVITGLEATAHRTPWTTCPQATAKLNEIVGLKISSDMLGTHGGLAAPEHCTHQFDLAMLAIVQAARGGSRLYDIAVTDPVKDRMIASLLWDSQPVLECTVEGSVLIAPESLKGTNLRTVKIRTLAEEDPELAENLSILRRAVMVAGGRGIDFDQLDDMSPFAQKMAGACFAFQPARIPLAKRSKGTIRDFTARPDAPLKG